MTRPNRGRTVEGRSYPAAQAKRRAYHRQWEAQQKVERDRQATPEALDAARWAAQAHGDAVAHHALAVYATTLLHRRLLVPAPEPYSTWMA